MTSLIGIYPGTFDPLTNGHIDIISGSIKLVDHLIVAVAENAKKGPLFSSHERKEMIKEAIDILVKKNPDLKNRIEVCCFDQLLVDFVRSVGGQVIIRGMRAVSDFENEFQMASMNYRLAPEVQTIFLTACDNNHFIASRYVKEIAFLGGDISDFVPQNVLKALQIKKSQREKIENCVADKIDDEKIK